MSGKMAHGGTALRKPLAGPVALAFALLAGALALAMQPAAAQSASGSRAGGITHVVHFSVPPIVRMRLVHAPPAIVVSARDVTAGYVDLDQPMEVEILTNLRGGYRLRFQLESPLVQSAEISGLASRVRLDGPGATVDFPRDSHPPGRRTLQLGFRLKLAPGAVPGVYPWPVSMAVARA